LIVQELMMHVNMLYGHLTDFDLSNFYHQHNVLSDPKEILYDIEKIVRRRAEISDSLLNARVFINNGTRDDFGYSVSNHPPYDEENLNEWLQRITGATSFCAVINGINGWSDTLSERINRDFNRQWVSRYGIPSQGIDVYTFMGKYRLTPFGIHKDQEHTFLYHLGPGIKKAWVWDPRHMDIAPLVQSDSFNLRQTLSWAHAIILRPGDALFIPQNWYHVLENPEFSVTLGVAPYEKKRKELLTSFLTDVLSDSPYDDSAVNINPCVLDNMNEYISSIVPEDLAKTNLYHVAQMGLSNLLGRLRSNHCFKYSSPPRKIIRKNYSYFGDFIIGEEKGDAMKIYLRGKEFIVSKKLKSCMQELNETISSYNFSYRVDGEISEDCFDQIIMKMITAGVLI